MNTYTQERRQARKDAKARYINPFKEGDILHHSWGYDQTNCDFYQVVVVKKASVVLRPIGSKGVEESDGFMSQSVMPVKDAFIEKGHHALTKYSEAITPDNPTITKLVQFYVNPDGSLRYFIPTPYGWCDAWDGKPEYSSWYA